MQRMTVQDTLCALYSVFPHPAFGHPLPEGEGILGKQKMEK